MGKLYWGGGHSSILQYRGKYHFHFLICWDELQNPFVKARKMSKTHIFQTLLSGGVCEKMQKANIVAFTKTNFGGPILTFANTPFTLFAFFSSFSPCLIQLLFSFCSFSDYGETRKLHTKFFICWMRTWQRNDCPKLATLWLL